jgi:hypothetical protein
MKALPSILCALLLCSCATDPNAGMVAARLTGQPEYLAFSRNGKADSAAVFPFAGKRYIYHPSFGSAALPPGDYPATACIPHSFLAQVQFEPRDAFLPHGCLVRAIADVRAKGGRVAMANGDARRVP